MEDLTEIIKKKAEDTKKKIEENINKADNKFFRLTDESKTDYLKLGMGIFGSFAATSPGLDWLPGPDWLYVLGALAYSAKKIYDINNYQNDKEKTNLEADKNG